MSSESLLLRLLDLEPLALFTFFFMPFISYKYFTFSKEYGLESETGTFLIFFATLLQPKN